MKWKYKHVYVTLAGGMVKGCSIQEELDQAGNEGWELVSIVGRIEEKNSYTGGTTTEGHDLFFKRPKE